MRLWINAVAFVAACGKSAQPAIPDSAGSGIDAPQTSSPDAPAAIVDLDGDGLDDAFETQIATDYMPYLSVASNDGCTLDGMVVRVRPHPADATKILIVYDHLFEHDCGLGGHVGDDEVFGVAIDPARPAPTGILAVRAVSHQATPCERDSQCSTCSGDSRAACDRTADGGAMWPVVYSSKDKHGTYATMGQCSLIGTCFDQCSLNTARARPSVINVGEPAHHLVSDLTTQGFITAANGWTEATLMNFDPWNPTQDFGGAGNIASDLVDAAFEAAPCAP
jgi:hypothetical protein